MTTAEDILRLAHIYAIKGDYEPFRAAVESLAAERDALKAAHEAIATLDHTRPLLDARAISRAALRGQP